MNLHDTKNFKASALDEDTLRRQAPSIFASGPMAGVSDKYTFVPTSQIVTGLREQNWGPVEVEEQRIRKEVRRGFQKHMIRFRRAEQMQTLDEWNVELVLLNSHDCGCAYQLHAGIYRRVCSNGLVISDVNFQAIRFRFRKLEPEEALLLATHALVLRYGSLADAPVEPQTLLQARCPEDEGSDIWTTMNKIQEVLTRGGVSDWHRDRRGKLRSVRALRGIDSKVGLNKGLWGLAERITNGETLPEAASMALAV